MTYLDAIESAKEDRRSGYIVDFWTVTRPSGVRVIYAHSDQGDNVYWDEADWDEDAHFIHHYG